MPIDTISLRCRREVQPRVARIPMSASRKGVHVRPSPRTVPNSCGAIWWPRREPGHRLLAASADTSAAPKYSNCLIFAIRLWLTGGGYLVVRKSRAGWFPHFLWCADLADARVLHFAPRKIAPWWYRPIHMLWFRGVVKRDDL